MLAGGGLALVAVLVTNLLAIGGMATFLQIRSVQLIDSDRLVRVARLTGGEPKVRTTPFTTGEDGVVVVLRPDGEVLDRLGLTAAGFAVPSPAEVRSFAADGQFRFFGGFAYFGVVDLLEDGRFVITARSLSGQLRAAWWLVCALGVLDVLTCALVVWGTAAHARRVLRPLERMAETAGRIAAGDLALRVEQDGVPTEVAQLGRAMNRMLAHIEHSFVRLSELDERLRRFVADAGHELRTPLTVMIGYLQLLRLGMLSEPAARRRAIEQVEGEARRLEALADQLLLLSRLDESDLPVCGPVDLDALVREVVGAVCAAHPEFPLEYHCTSTPPVIHGDESSLRQVLACLLANIRIHTPPGTASGVRVGHQPPDVVVDVVDEGPGIPAVARTQVFERFFRGDAARRRPRDLPDEQGRGLGLSVVHAVVTAHGGTVVVQPSDRGTWIRIRIPASPGASATIPE